MKPKPAESTARHTDKAARPNQNELSQIRQCALEMAVELCRDDKSLEARDVITVACQFEHYLQEGRNLEIAFMSTLACQLEDADVEPGVTRPIIEKISKFLYERGCLL